MVQDAVVQQNQREVGWEDGWGWYPVYYGLSVRSSRGGRVDVKLHFKTGFMFDFDHSIPPDECQR